MALALASKAAAKKASIKRNGRHRESLKSISENGVAPGGGGQRVWRRETSAKATSISASMAKMVMSASAYRVAAGGGVAA